ncbi:diguanylate cyclase [Sulfurimonas sp.]|uniref:diguanylate cyclase domain-containing protein n=1 Tax=Sulfurimonas sp. TaxID=2022749 RepID=UPI0026015DC0|nr:diguanylate cyclase [Sulfurimonas sp.]MDD5157333.1 diguanylate cyclase [Sulfurimonas sp.]
MNKYRLNLHFPLIGSVLAMFIITIFSFMYFQETAIHGNKKNIVDKFFNNLELESEYDTKVFSNFIDMVGSDSSIIKSFESKNKKELFDLTKPLFDKLNKDIDLTHFYFILNDGTVFLRVHNFNKDGDTIKRATFLDAQKTNSLSSGLEFGLMKSYTLRAVKPWIVDGKKIGYIEFGKDIGKTIESLSKLLDTQIFIAVKKEIFTDAPKEVKNRLSDKISTKNDYIKYNTTIIPKEINDIVNGKLNNTDINLGDGTYFVSLAPMKDISKKKLGSFIFLSNVSSEHSLMYSSIKILTLFLTALTLILLTIGFGLIKRREDTISTLTEQLDKKNRKLQKLFDIQKNIIIISDGKKTLLVNEATLNFFAVESIEEFRKISEDISGRFIASNGYFSLEKVPNNKNWITTIEPLSGDARIITMKDADGASHTFNISISQFEEEQYLISFTDISATMVEKINLSKKIEKDELTDAFNRKFFNKNIASIIKSLDSHTYLGVAMIDIDFFKKVNDTHGHNAGDIVLQQFSQYIKSSIRLDDFLIRWGGEEFIILIKTKSKEALLRAAEHIRQKIEKSKFDIVGNITCSIGITIYIPGEDIIRTIERADIAMYKSKESGRNMVSQLENSDTNELEVPTNEECLRAVLDENAIIVNFESNLLDNHRYLPEEVIGKNWFDIFIDTSDTKETMNYFKEILSAKDGKIDKHTNDIILKDKTHMLLDFENTVFTKEAKRFVLFVAKEHSETYL